MIYCFGDSWAKGAELTRTTDGSINEKPFVEHFGVPFENWGICGIGYGLVTSILLDQRYKMTSNDVVLIVIPPNNRWMSQHKHEGRVAIDSLTNGKTPNKFIRFDIHSNYDGKEDSQDYLRWAEHKDEHWFVYHASMYTFLIQSALDKVGCKYLFMHNYGGEFIIDDRFKSLIDTNNFLDIKNSLTTLLGGNYLFRSGERFTGKYFEGKVAHPNELGHKKIAEMVKDALR